jgi:hypothetical protein
MTPDKPVQSLSFLGLINTVERADSLLKAIKFFCSTEFQGCALTSITGFCASCLTTVREPTPSTVFTIDKKIGAIPFQV